MSDADPKFEPGGSYRHYTIDSLIGEGGMSSVWRAHHRLTGRRVAIKVMRQPTAHETLVGSPQLLERFRREASLLSELQHPNLPIIYDMDIGPNGAGIIVMEYLEGKDLAYVIDYNGRLSVADALFIAIEICRPLRLAHERGFVHRDLKPANIFICKAVAPDGGGRVRVLDFGIAKGRAAKRITKESALVGTVGCMSPEHMLGLHDEIDHRSDQYALGCILHEMLTGFPVFIPDRANPPDAGTLCIRHIEIVPPRVTEHRPEIPEAVADLVAKLLSKRPEDRFASADEVLATLVDLLRRHIESTQGRETVFTPSDLMAPDIAAGPRVVHLHAPMITEPMPTTPAGATTLLGLARTDEDEPPTPLRAARHLALVGAARETRGSEARSPPPPVARHASAVVGIASNAAPLARPPTLKSAVRPMPVPEPVPEPVPVATPAPSPVGSAAALLARHSLGSTELEATLRGRIAAYLDAAGARDPESSRRALERALTHPEPLMRLAAGNALGAIGDRNSVVALRRALAREQAPVVLACVERALAALESVPQPPPVEPPAPVQPASALAPAPTPAPARAPSIVPRAAVIRQLESTVDYAASLAKGPRLMLVRLGQVHGGLEELRMAYPVLALTTIGRGDDTDIVFVNPDVSREHARLAVVAPGRYCVKNLGVNGIEVNGKTTEEAEIGDGDVIGICGFELQLLIPPQAAPVREAVAQPPARPPAAGARPSKAAPTRATSGPPGGLGLDVKTQRLLIWLFAGVIAGLTALLLYLELAERNPVTPKAIPSSRAGARP